MWLKAGEHLVHYHHFIKAFDVVVFPSYIILMSQYTECATCLLGFTVQESFINKEKAKHGDAFVLPRKCYKCHNTNKVAVAKNRLDAQRK